LKPRGFAVKVVHSPGWSEPGVSGENFNNAGSPAEAVFMTKKMFERKP